ncbi:hypothetical protein SASPL_130352 [Salvia splendens]|uniref:Hapless 8 n=1 Tax=Salvia splendens TaxID=180675 RepID=A0A8X8X5X6_SALSN|nr:uncharacterized protein LOC121755741 [Salvia splendens]KAG6407363.1 hypothetical protein SASPL_130352 [Salvia splendens]
MLSTENPPLDLCEIPQLKSGDDGSGESNQQQLLGVDLLKSGLDDKNPLPNFSIRDYVFNTRGKEIKNNWPFSQKNLQLCLKHGVKDVLPPFQPLRNPSQGVVDSLRYSDVKFPESNGCGVCKRPANNVDNVNSSEVEEDKEFPSIRESKKAEINIQSPVKKCRLIVEQRANEDTAVVSETMTSKVCPVCKTFSSSSNTTLNAHIDQCLSGESTIEWTANPKVNKHRIKPRKTRLMVDIYETALRCTLEDLDKRNGTSWASNTGLHPQDLEVSVEEEKTKKTCSPLDFEDINCEGGAVYIDSCGTKLCILSKLNHPSSKSSVNDSGACKLVKRDKGIQLHLTKKKKKKHTVQRLEVQKNSLDGRGSCSPVPNQLPDCPPHGPKTYYPMLEINEGQTKVYPSESHEEDDPTKSPTASDHMKFNDFGMIKGWVRSKRTGLKKNNLELEIQHPDKSLKNLQVKSVSLLGGRGNSAPISPISSNENPVLPPEGRKRKENLCRSLEGVHELPCLRKGPGFSSLRSEHRTEKKNHSASKFNVKQSRKDISSVHERILDPPNRAENHAPSRSNKRVGSSSPTVKNVSSFGGSSISHHRTFSNEGVIATPKKRSLGHAMSPGGRKFSSLRTMLSSVKHPSGEEPKKNLGRDLSSFKNPGLRCTSRSDDEAVVSQPTFHVEDNLVVKKNYGEPLSYRNGVLKLHKRIGRFVNKSEGDMTSKGSETSHESDSDNVGNKIDSFMAGSVPIDSVLGEEVEMMDDFVCEPAETDEEAFVSFNKSLDSAFPVGPVSQYYSKAYDGHCPTELVFHSDREMFRADNAGKNLVTPDSHEMSEMDGDEAQGNYFVDVDPIPIPGPPGSFLPSPGRMSSEELLGHSSLTTCRIQSSDGGHEVVDMDSSDSPISAMSTVSNSIAGRSSSISTTNLSAQSHFTAERNNPVVEGFPPFEQIACVEKEPNHVKMSYEVQNIKPCCCSRKDASLKGGSLNYQESQRLRRQTVTPLSVIPQEKQITKNEICFIDLTAETLSEKEPTKSASGYVPHNPEAMFRDSEFPSPSTSNPVLRLMGKNLMVVNKEDNLPSQSSTMTDHPGVRLCVDGRNNQNEPNSLHHTLSQGPSYMPAHHLDFNPSDPFKIPTNYRPPCHPPTTMNSSVKPTSAPGYHEYGNGFSLISPDTRTTAYDSEWALRRKILLVADARK